MKNDLICFSHLRWNFVYQRPQHLMSRFAKAARVYYVEEPVLGSADDHLHIRVESGDNVFVVTPHLCESIDAIDTDKRLANLVDKLIEDHQITEFISWYYFPIARAFTRHLKPVAIVYDCMDELSAFKNPPMGLVEFEKELIAEADLVFTGGFRLYEAKKNMHRHIFPFPSAIDKEFFFPARAPMPEPQDQGNIPHPRLGFFGVIDERFDIKLVADMAQLKPDWHFIFIGPVVKINPADLPGNANIHYLGMKDYRDLPKYISGWDICIMPFAINESTKYISPTKTPEFLAAGKKVISTRIHDVVNPYGSRELVGIADTAEEFVEIATKDLLDRDRSRWLGKVDEFLSKISWEKTWKSMESKIDKVVEEKLFHNLQKKKTHV